MAPRQKINVESEYVDEPTSKEDTLSENGHNEITKHDSESDHQHQYPYQHSSSTHKTETQKQRLIFFRIGPLRFGVHGIAGILGTIFVSFALVLSHYNQSISTWLSIAVVVSTLISSLGSYGLLSQVPKQSHIASWIFPPHREAFKRTIAIVGYLNLRLVHEWQWKVPFFHNNESIVFPILLLLYTNYNFFPFHFDYKNGNTWVFVIPMFVAFNIESMHQFPRCDSFGDTLSNILTRKNDNSFDEDIDLFSSLVSSSMNWDEVHDWNQNKVDETYLLLTLFCALQIAFMFTLAFRGLMSIRYCYWIAAIQVGLLCIRLFNTV